MCNKALNTYPFDIQCQYKTQEICVKAAVVKAAV